MMITEEDIKNLTLYEREKMIGMLWRSIPQKEMESEISDEVKGVLLEREKDANENPDQENNWEEFRKTLQ